MTLKPIDRELLHTCTGGGDRAGLVKDLTMFHRAGGIPWGYPAGYADRIIGDLYERRGF